MLENTDVVRNPALRYTVGAWEQHADGGRCADRPRRWVGANVLYVVDERRGDAAVVVERHARVAVFVAAHACGHEVLSPVLDPLERDWQLHGSERDAHVLAHRNDLLAEAAPRVAHDHPHLVFADPKQPSQEHADFMR